MTWARWLVCAGAFLFLAGCAWDHFNLAFLASSASGQDRVFTGSLDSVAQSCQGALRQLNLDFQVTREDGVVRMASATRNGQRFSLVLTRETADQSEQTRVRFEWEKGADEQMATQILSVLTMQRAR